MSQPIISVYGIGKKYKINPMQGGRTYKALRDTLANVFTKGFRFFTGDQAPGTGNSSDFWALKDISFDIQQGEVVGIIGRNGAGKTTLLKILSQITEPTEGEIRIRGRVASLLEVGTGFHPELTGRENIFLNGAILGMKRVEIKRKFDEIATFAEVEKFIDTPVKRYSSGMYVRLAFAVAAHLEPEILLVDEVLAVGDAAFQKKCLGKMGDVAKEGRTVLFVSHNMQAVQSLCQSALRLEAGQIVTRGNSSSVVTQYLSGLNSVSSEAIWPAQTAPGNDELKLISIRVHSGDGNTGGIYSSSKDLYVELEFIVHTNHPALCVGFDLTTAQGVTLLRSYQTDLPHQDWPPIKIGKNRWCCIIPRGLLNGGLYYICPRIGLHNICWIVNLDAAVQFEVLLDHGVSPFWNSLDDRNRPGNVAPILRWDVMS